MTVLCGCAMIVCLKLRLRLFTERDYLVPVWRVSTFIFLLRVTDDCVIIQVWCVCVCARAARVCA